MIDSHCHLDLPKLFTRADSVLDNASKNGIKRILIPGTTPQGWCRQQALVKQNASEVALDIAFGIHPYFLQTCDLEHALSELRTLLSKSPQVIAIGEIGLDTAIDCPLDTQQRAFASQLALAEQFELPVIMHHRKSHHLLLGALKQHQFNRGGVIHAFSGSVEVAMQYLERGFYLGVGGTITYPRGSKTRKTLKAIFPEFSDRLLLETDAPDMPMCGRQGMVNEPAYLGEVVSCLSNLLEIDSSEVVNLTTKNYQSLFQSYD